MHIVSALFVDRYDTRPAPGPSTRLDLNGVFFSIAAPSPVPVTIEPHLLAIIYCPPDHPGQGVFEVVFRTGPGEQDPQMARNVSPFTVEPGKFTYRLVRSELEMAAPGRVVAHCRVGTGPWHLVPLTVVAP